MRELYKVSAVPGLHFPVVPYKSLCFGGANCSMRNAAGCESSTLTEPRQRNSHSCSHAWMRVCLTSMPAPVCWSQSSQTLRSAQPDFGAGGGVNPLQDQEILTSIPIFHRECVRIW